jgi:hypothetical protein
VSRPLQEPDVLPTRALILVGAGTVAVTLLCLLWVFLVMSPLESGRAGVAPLAEVPPAEVGAGTPIDETLFSGEEGRGQLLRARQRARLESYGPVDGAPGRVHIPIARAMELIAAGATP